jgi:hypothetical protein
MSTLKATINELKLAGLDYEVTYGGKHIKVKAEGLPPIVCSQSCSDRLGEVKARSLVRRLIRQNGLGIAA